MRTMGRKGLCEQCVQVTANYGTVTGKRRWCGGCAKGQAGAVSKTKPMKKKAPRYGRSNL